MSRINFGLCICFFITISSVYAGEFVFTEKNLQRISPAGYVRRTKFLDQKKFAARYATPRAKEMADDLLRRYKLQQVSKGLDEDFLLFVQKIQMLGLSDEKLRLLKILASEQIQMITGLSEQELEKFKNMSIEDIKKFLAGKGVVDPTVLATAGQEAGFSEKLLEIIEKIRQQNLSDQQLLAIYNQAFENPEKVALLTDEEIGQLKEKKDDEIVAIIEEKKETEEEEAEFAEGDGDEDDADDDDESPPEMKEGELEFKKEKVIEGEKKEEALADEPASDKAVADALRDIALSFKQGQTVQEYFKTFTNEFFKKKKIRKKDDFKSIIGESAQKKGLIQTYIQENIINAYQPESVAVSLLYNMFSEGNYPDTFKNFVNLFKPLFYDEKKIDDVKDHLITIYINFIVAARSTPEKGKMYEFLSDNAVVVELKKVVNKSKTLDEFIKKIDYLRLHTDFQRFYELLGGEGSKLPPNVKIKPFIQEIRDSMTQITNVGTLRPILLDQLFFDKEKYKSELSSMNEKFKLILKTRKGVSVQIKTISFSSIKNLKSLMTKLRFASKTREEAKNVLDVINKGEWNDSIMENIKKIASDSDKFDSWQGNIEKLIKKGIEIQKVMGPIQAAFKVLVKKTDLKNLSEKEKIFYDELIKIPSVSEAVKKSFKNDLFRTADSALEPIKQYLLADKETRKLLKQGTHYERIQPFGFLLSVLKDIQTNGQFFGRRFKVFSDVLWSFIEGTVFSSAKKYNKMQENISFIRAAYTNNRLLYGTEKPLQSMKDAIDKKNIDEFIKTLTAFVAKAKTDLEKADKFENLVVNGTKMMQENEPYEKMVIKLFLLNEGNNSRFQDAPIIPSLDVGKGTQVDERELVFRATVLDILRGKFINLLTMLGVVIKDDENIGLYDRFDQVKLDFIKEENKKFTDEKANVLRKIRDEVNKSQFERLFEGSGDIANQKRNLVLQAIEKLFEV